MNPWIVLSMLHNKLDKSEIKLFKFFVTRFQDSCFIVIPAHSFSLGLKIFSARNSNTVLIYIQASLLFYTFLAS